MTFTQSIVDDSIQKNIEFHSKADLRPRITRTLVGKGCEWCRNLAGLYLYSEAPKDVYRRHERCRCIVNYHSGDGRKQDVWSKKWNAPDKDDKIELRKRLNRKNSDIRQPFKAISKKRFDQLTIEARKNGAKIIRGETWANNHLDSVGASASR